MFRRVHARGTRKHFHERLYVHVSNILIHLAVFLYRIRNRRSDGAHCSRNFAQVLFSKISPLTQRRHSLFLGARRDYFIFTNQQEIIVKKQKAKYTSLLGLVGQMST